MLSWLFPWRHRRRGAQLHFVMYTRQGCHLCEEAWQHLRSAQERFRFSLEAVDVDADADLIALHGNCVPVVTVNGKVRFRGKVNPVLLKRLFRRGGVS